MSRLILIKGCSGSGKSSRVSYLMDSLIDKGGFTPEPLFYNDSSTEIGKTIGNFSFLGKYTNRLGEKKWQGLDSVTTKFGTSENISKFVRNYLDNNLDNYLVIEGAGTTLSWRWRPVYLEETMTLSDCLMVYYNFPIDKRDRYIDRIVGRSGKPPNSEAMWRKNKSFHCEFEKSCKEKENKDMFKIYHRTDEAPLDDLCSLFKVTFGIDWL